MIVLLDTSSGLCRVALVKDTERFDYEWHADRSLAQHLLKYITERLAEHGLGVRDITGIGVMRGPGSFTGLRIGLTVMNTLAYDLSIPIVGAEGDRWQETALTRLRAGENDKLVMPEYGSAANITKPRK